MTKKFEPVLIVGCSHGKHVCPVAKSAVLRFKAEFKPKIVAHLGDFCDTAGLRSGARGTADESEPLDPDIAGGLEFLDEIGATIVLAGNHEDRAWSLMASPNAVVSYAAGKIVHAITDHCAKRKAVFHRYNGVFQEHRLGDFVLTHGTIYNENTTRDMATSYGNVVHAHTHRPGIAYGRTNQSPIGIGVGTLTKRREMSYAKNRLATFAWGQAFVWGYTNGRETHLNLCLGPQEQQPNSRWFLP